MVLCEYPFQFITMFNHIPIPMNEFFDVWIFRIVFCDHDWRDISGLFRGVYLQ